MDMPDNYRRIGYVHNTQLFTDTDLYFGMCLLIRLDMLFNDPCGTEKRDGARRMLMSQKSLTPLLLVLKGQIWNTKLEVMREWIKWKYDPTRQDRNECEATGIFGVPLDQCGMLKHQYWGNKEKMAELSARAAQEGTSVYLLLRPDQMITREAMKRGLRFRGFIVHCMLYGYVNQSLEDIDYNGEDEHAVSLRRDPRLEGHGEYDFDHLVGGGTSVEAEDGGDALLDLGKKKVSGIRFSAERIGEQERNWRDGEAEFVAKCRAWWREEMRDARLAIFDPEIE
jgi:hypothetical protein